MIMIQNLRCEFDSHLVYSPYSKKYYEYVYFIAVYVVKVSSFMSVCPFNIETRYH